MMVRLQKTECTVRKQEDYKKLYTAVSIHSFRKQNRVLGLSIAGIAIAFIVFCYAAWRDKGTTNPNDFFKDATAKDFILNQVVLAH